MARLTVRGTDYAGLASTLGRYTHRRIGHNTYLQRIAADQVTVVYHSTAIVRVWDTAVGDIVRLNSGGWQTVTTKQRMNYFMPARYALVQQDRTWYLADRWADWKLTPYRDGVEFVDGTLIGAGQS